jgi:hypothetical protein
MLKFIYSSGTWIIGCQKSEFSYVYMLQQNTCELIPKVQKKAEIQILEVTVMGFKHTYCQMLHCITSKYIQILEVTVMGF